MPKFKIGSHIVRKETGNNPRLIIGVGDGTYDYMTHNLTYTKQEASWVDKHFMFDPKWIDRKIEEGLLKQGGDK